MAARAAEASDESEPLQSADTSNTWRREQRSVCCVLVYAFVFVVFVFDLFLFDVTMLWRVDCELV
eukprot:m.198631 g.198631  ORF g.198631 m.198631 type:complete len:65 (-) comp15485_c1_seq1:2293-2487(-)